MLCSVLNRVAVPTSMGGKLNCLRTSLGSGSQLLLVPIRGLEPVIEIKRADGQCFHSGLCGLLTHHTVRVVRRCE